MMRKPKYTNCEPLLALLIFIRSKSAIVRPATYSLPSTTGLRRALILAISSMQKTFLCNAIDTHVIGRMSACGTKRHYCLRERTSAFRDETDKPFMRPYGPV